MLQSKTNNLSSMIHKGSRTLIPYVESLGQNVPRVRAAPNPCLRAGRPRLWTRMSTGNPPGGWQGHVVPRLTFWESPHQADPQLHAAVETRPCGRRGRRRRDTHFRWLRRRGQFWEVSSPEAEKQALGK